MGDNGKRIFLLTTKIKTMKNSIHKAIYLKSTYGASYFYEALKSGFVTAHNQSKTYRAAVNYAEWLLV